MINKQQLSKKQRNQLPQPQLGVWGTNRRGSKVIQSTGSVSQSSVNQSAGVNQC
jgi:hypothetical protein